MLLFAFIMNDVDGAEKSTFIVDENLILRIGQNDSDAIDALYRDTEKTMYAFALSLTRRHEEALDLMQDTYVKVISAAHLYKPMGKPLAWMFTICKNLFLSEKRKHKKYADFNEIDFENDVLFSYEMDYEDQVVLKAALGLLTDEERQIILLYAVSGLKHKEIADAIGLGLSTTLSKYHRGLKKLRKHLLDGGLRNE